VSLNIFLKTYEPSLSPSDIAVNNDKRRQTYYVSSDSDESLLMAGLTPDRRDSGYSSDTTSSSDEKEQLNLKLSNLPLWTVCTICLLSRVPYFEELGKCLEFAYHASLLPEIERWEIERDEKCHLELSLIPSLVGKSEDHGEWKEEEETVNRGGNFNGGKFDPRSFSIDFIQNNNQPAIINPSVHSLHSYAFPFPSCRILLDKLIGFLFLECPKPIPKLLSITLLLSSSPSNKDTITEKVSFVARNPEFLPNPSNRLSYILHSFGPRVMLDILNCLLSESRMIFFSKDINKLSIICEGFRQLIYPLVWTHVYLPIVPLQLLSLVEAPVPFLLGTHSENISHINLHSLNEIILIDCDNGLIMENNNSVATQTMSCPVKLPDKEDRWLMLSLKELYKIQMMNYDNGGNSLSGKNTAIHEWKEINNIDLILQLLFYDIMIRLLRNTPDCLFYLSSTCPMFNRHVLLNEYTSPDYKKTLEHLSITNAFHVLTENVYSSSLKFFLFCVKKVEQEENHILPLIEESNGDDDIVAEAATVRPPSILPPTSAAAAASPTLSPIQEEKVEDIKQQSSLWACLQTVCFCGKASSKGFSKKLTSFLGSPFSTSSETTTKEERELSLQSINSSKQSSISHLSKNDILKKKKSVTFRKELEHENFPFFFNSLQGCLPEWIINEDSTASIPYDQKNDNLSDYILYLIEQRMKYYKKIIYEYLKRNNKNSPMNKNQNGHITLNNLNILSSSFFSSCSTQTLYNLEFSPEITVCKERVNYQEILNQETSLDGSEGDNGKLTILIPGERGSGSTDREDSSLFTLGKNENMAPACLLMFHPSFVEEAKKSSEPWTISRLAKHFHLSDEQFLTDLKKCPYSLVYEDKNND
jgi:hypothetical protein